MKREIKKSKGMKRITISNEERFYNHCFIVIFLALTLVMLFLAIVLGSEAGKL